MTACEPSESPGIAARSGRSISSSWLSPAPASCWPAVQIQYNHAEAEGGRDGSLHSPGCQGIVCPGGHRSGMPACRPSAARCSCLAFPPGCRRGHRQLARDQRVLLHTQLTAQWGRERVGDVPPTSLLRKPVSNLEGNRSVGVASRQTSTSVLGFVSTSGISWMPGNAQLGPWGGRRVAGELSRQTRKSQQPLQPDVQARHTRTPLPHHVACAVCMSCVHVQTRHRPEVQPGTSAESEGLSPDPRP